MKTRSKIIWVSALLVILAAGVAVVMATPAMQWRLGVVGLKATGSLPDIGWRQLFSMLQPGSPFYLEPLWNSRNPYASIRNPYSTDADLVSGGETFKTHCASCHGPIGEGGTGPAINTGAFSRGDSDWALFRTITLGIPGTAMQAHELPEQSVWQVVAHMRTLSRQSTQSLVAKARELPLSQAVPYTRILNATNEPESWLTYAANYDGSRFSRLNEIDRANVEDLELKWLYQMKSPDRIVETTPLVVGPHMYVTEPPHNVIALDARTGEEIWAYRRRVPPQVSLCCDRVNRGLAILEDKLYLGTLDAHLVCLDARSGRVLWDVEVGVAEEGYSITAAPLAVKNKIVIGVSGGEFGIRGFLDAYDAETGERAWRFHTIPGPDEPGNETWSDDSWKTGGGPTWVTGSLDPHLNLLYWGVGNPAPDFQGDVRKGDNLYTNSVIALNPDSGDLVWHFQFTPHDEHDWDANQTPVLIDAMFQGRLRKLMLWANKNGFHYVLDRESGEFLFARPFAKQTWADGLELDGRPIVREDSRPTAKGTRVAPGASGATNWWPPSYSHSSQLYYVPVLEKSGIFFRGPVEFDEGELFLGSASTGTAGEDFSIGIRALVPLTGDVRWEYAGVTRSAVARTGGILSTAGGLVFWGDGTRFSSLDADTGEELWRVNAGGQIFAPAVTYAVDGRQRVTIAAGRSILTFGLD